MAEPAEGLGDDRALGPGTTNRPLARRRHHPPHSYLITSGVKNHPAHYTRVEASAYKCASTFYSIHFNVWTGRADGMGKGMGFDPSRPD